MAANLDLTAKDTASSLKVTLYDQDGNIIDLTGASVTLQFYIDSYSATNPVSQKVMTIATPPTAGIVSYQFTVNNNTTPPTYDLANPGILHYKIQVKFADGSILTTPFEGEITIHDSLI